MTSVEIYLFAVCFASICHTIRIIRLERKVKKLQEQLQGGS